MWFCCSLFYVILFIYGIYGYKLTAEISDIGDDDYSSGRIIMDGGKYVAIPNINGKFTFNDISVGEHSIEVYYKNYEFYMYLIDVRSNGQIRASIKGGKDRLPPKLIITPKQIAKYIPDQKQYNPLSFLKSGPGIMIIIMIFSSVIMPKMLDAVKDQQQFEQQQQQEQQKTVKSQQKKQKSVKK
mmetsp:Transcript_27159/g.33124  ORF Transcript_27159/g.33124 Transcript_27159/m.33124 type:complete len:184 (+) Transcript_27159:54-605(+)